jgi:type II secretory pathway component PulF
MNKTQISLLEEDLLEWVPLNFFLFFTPRFIRARIVGRLLAQLNLMIRNQIPLVEGLRTTASPRRVRLPVHYAIGLIVLFFAVACFALILVFLFGGPVFVVAAVSFLFLLFLLRPEVFLGFLLIGILFSLTQFFLGSVVGTLIFLFFFLFFLQMNIQSVKINDSYLVRRVARQLARTLANGTSLGLAMKSLPRLFTPFHTMMIAGESTGKMGEALHHLAEYERLRGRFYVIGLKNFAYPIILFFIAFTLISFTTIVILPKFEGIFAQINVPLPEFTKSIVSFLASIPTKGGLGLLFLIVMAIIIFSAWGSLKYYIPVIRNIARPLSASRFFMALGYQLKARLPINEAVRMARHVDTGLVFSGYMQGLQERIEKGVPLGTALQQVAIFPPLVKHWVSMAEFAEALDTELIDMAKKLAEDGKAGFTKLTITLEPIVHLIIAFLIGLVVISFYLPIFNIPVAVPGAGG